MSDLKARLLDRFRDPEYRHAYLEEFLNSVVSAQIRDLREENGWSQAELGEKIGTTQSAISRNESPDYSSWSIETLRRLARALDRALIVKFASFGEAVDDIERFRADRLLPPSFANDSAFRAGKPVASKNTPSSGGSSKRPFANVLAYVRPRDSAPSQMSHTLINVVSEDYQESDYG